MSLVGRKDLFAIEWHPEGLMDNYYYGHLCFWIFNLQVGNYIEVSTLSISISYLKDFLSNRAERLFPNSVQLDETELFNIIYDRFFSGESIRDGSYLMMHKFRDVFWLDEIGEYSFRDKIGMFIVDEPELNRQRIFWKSFNDNIIYQCILPLGFFDMVAAEYVQAIELEILSSKVL